MLHTIPSYVSRKGFAIAFLACCLVLGTFTSVSHSALGQEGVYEWHTFLGTSGSDWAYAIAIDAQDNIFVVGKAPASWNGPGNIPPLHAFSASEDIVVVKLSPTGQYLWHTFYGSPSFDGANAIAVGADGDLFIAGGSHGNWTGLGDVAPRNPYKYGEDIFILKLSNEGDYQWHTFLGSDGGLNVGDWASGIAIDSSENIYITGASKKAWYGSNNRNPLHRFTEDDEIVIVKVNSSGDYLWHTFYGSDWPGSEAGKAIAVDSGGNVYVSAQSTRGFIGDYNTAPRHAYNGNTDFVVIKLDTNGGYLWHTFYGSPNNDQSGGIAVDQTGVYVAGESPDDWIGPNNAAPLHSFDQYGNLTVFKLKSDGDYLWHTFYGSQGIVGNNAGSVALDKEGGVYLIGDSSGTWNGPNAVAPRSAYQGDHDMVILKLTQNGEYGWHTFYGSAGMDRANGIAVDSQNEVYVVGASRQSWQGPGGEQSLISYNGSDDMVVVKSGLERAVPNLILIPLPNPTYVGDIVTLQVQATGEVGVPSGTVTFYRDQTEISSVLLDASGTASIEVSGLGEGIYPISVSYNGDSQYGPLSKSLSGGLTVQKRTTAMTLGAAAIGLYQQPVTITVVVSVQQPDSVTPTGVVVISDGSTELSRVDLVNGTAEYTTQVLSVGSHSITAEYLGNNAFSSSMSTLLDPLLIKAIPQVTITASPNPAVFGETVKVSAAVTGEIDLPTGTVVFSEGDSELWTGPLDADGFSQFETSQLDIGQHTIRVTYLGNDHYITASQDLAEDLIITKLKTSTKLTIPTSARYGQPVTLVAEVSAVSSPEAGIPTGMIMFWDGKTLLGGTSLQDGTASLEVTTLAIGNHLLSANYGGNDQFESSSGNASDLLTIDQAIPLISLTIAPSSVMFGEQAKITVTVQSTAGMVSGNVTLMDGTMPLATVPLVDGAAQLETTLLTPGVHTIHARYNGNELYAPVKSMDQTFQVYRYNVYLPVIRYSSH